MLLTVLKDWCENNSYFPLSEACSSDDIIICGEGETCTDVEFEYHGTFTYPEDKTVTGRFSGRLVYCGPKDSTEFESYPDEHCDAGFKTAFKESMSKKNVVFSEITSSICITPRIFDSVEESHIEEFKNKGNED